MGDVVAVAEVREPEARELPEVLLQGQQVGERLARVVQVGERVDDRDRRRSREAPDVVVVEGADDEGAGVAAHHPGGVLDRLAPAELELGRSDDLGDAAEVGDGGAERQPRPGRRLGEVGDDRVAAEQLRPGVRILADLLAEAQQVHQVVG